MIKENYYPNGKLRVEKCYIIDKRSRKKRRHREDGPAITEYYKNGNISKEIFYKNGQIHREDGPAIITYYENGNIKFSEYLVSSKVHRIDGPALTWYYENGNVEKETYYINGEEYKDMLQYMIAIGCLK